jgi:hypothetical protein
VAEIRLTDFVIFQCEFELWPDQRGKDQSEAAVVQLAAESPEDYVYPEGDFLRYAPTTLREEDGFALFVNAALEDDQLPFSLRITYGARYAIGDDAKELATEAVEPTLFWLAFPYLREAISNTTGRSPLGPYYLPPLSRLPDPSAGGTEPTE